MFSELSKRVQKAGMPPGTAIYTGNEKITPTISIVSFDQNKYDEVCSHSYADCLEKIKTYEKIWIHVEGLSNTEIITELAKKYNLHPLTVEDILNVDQRSKVEEFENYLFITIKSLAWNVSKNSIVIEPMSLVFGKNFVLSFQERPTDIFTTIRNRLKSGPIGQRLRKQGSDYLVYRLIDTVIDQYFLVLEGIGDQIEKVEELIISQPTPQNAKTIYRLKRQMLTLRKTIWPIREAISHLLQVDRFITPFTQIYFRDIYDHVAQAIDIFETFRDMLAGMIDIYLSSITNRMNEIMKVLTIISTIFIPTTFIASIYGMNFEFMPELKWRYGYPLVLGAMFLVVIGMLIFFRRKKWI